MSKHQPVVIAVALVASPEIRLAVSVARFVVNVPSAAVARVVSVPIADELDASPEMRSAISLLRFDVNVPSAPVARVVSASVYAFAAVSPVASAAIRAADSVLSFAKRVATSASIFA